MHGGSDTDDRSICRTATHNSRQTYPFTHTLLHHLDPGSANGIGREIVNVQTVTDDRRRHVCVVAKGHGRQDLTCIDRSG